MTAILITRPQAAAELTAEELQSHGYEGVIEPMLRIRGTDMPPPDTKEIQALMITSANAVAALDMGDYNVEELFGFPCFCVGPRTAERAEQLGFRRVKHSAQDGKALAQLVAESLPDKAKAVLHIAARDTDSKAQDALEFLGYRVSRWPIYEAIPTTGLSSYTIKRLREKQLDAVLVFSVRTAETLIGLLRQNGLEDFCKDMVAIGISQNVCDALAPIGWRKVLAAEQPLEQSVLDCIRSNLEPSLPSQERVG